jgi:hypothetical protein
LRERAFACAWGSLLAVVPVSARAALEAHLFVDRIQNIGSLFHTDANDHVNESSGVNFGEEPYWHVAIVDVDMYALPPTATAADLAPHASFFSESTCANWDVTTTLVVNRDFARVIPGNQFAWFYVGVFDYDSWITNNQSNTWLAETLGDHHVNGLQNFLLSPQQNNDLSRWHLPGETGSWCGDQPAGTGQAQNWSIRYRTYYVDTTPPSAASAPAHDDASAPPWRNDDAVMRFAWTRGADADSGIVQTIRIERLSDGGSCEVAMANAQTSFDVTGTLSCAAGSLASLALTEGQSYRARVRTRNGDLPPLDAPASVDGAYSPWVMQLAAPEVPALPPIGALVAFVSLAATAWVVINARRAAGARGRGRGAPLRGLRGVRPNP